MHNSSWIIVKRFIENNNNAKILKFLSEKELQLFDKAPLTTTENIPSLLFEDDFLKKIHYSWFVSIINELPTNIRPLFLGLFDEDNAKSLKKMIKTTSSKLELTNVANKFFQNYLISNLIGKNPLLPINFLPPSPLIYLLSLSKEELIKIIDFLSLYDLVFEMKHIVETKILKKIYSFLSPQQRDFIEKKANYKEPFSITRMGLDRWDGDEKTLKTILHKRGLIRFSKALSYQNSSFIWYMCHFLDIGRGQNILTFVKNKCSKDLSDAIIANILELTELLTKR
jgi:hypothetical protein